MIHLKGMWEQETDEHERDWWKKVRDKHYLYTAWSKEPS